MFINRLPIHPVAADFDTDFKEHWSLGQQLKTRSRVDDVLGNG